MRATQRPRATSSPRLSAPASPKRSSFRTTRSRRSGYASSTAGVASVEPSSTTTSSKSDTVCREMLASAGSRCSAPFDTATSTDACGARDTASRSLRRVPTELPSFDLVVATIGRVSELERLLESLAAQTHRSFRILVVDQNPDARLAPVLERASELEVVLLTAPPGLSHARNRALPELRGDLVAFPDDDCAYPPDLLERVAARFARDLSLDGLSARTADREGCSDTGWRDDVETLRKRNVWNLVASAGLFLRRAVIARVGTFDERLG